MLWARLLLLLLVLLLCSLLIILLMLLLLLWRLWELWPCAYLWRCGCLHGGCLSVCACCCDCCCFRCCCGHVHVTTAACWQLHGQPGTLLLP